MFDVKRLHPAALIFNCINILKQKELIIPIIAGFATFRDEGFIYFILILLAGVLLAIVYSFLRWYRFIYYVHGNEIRIEQGIFVRKKRYISFSRIHSIDLTASVIHRLFKLVKVQIETAGNNETAEVFLSAIKMSEGEQLRRIVRAHKTETGDTAPSDEEQKENPSYTIATMRLLVAGMTSGSIGVLFGVLIFFSSEVENYIPEHFYNETFNWLIGLGIVFIIGMIIIGLLLLWLLGIVGTIIKYWRFTIIKNGSEIFISRGLLEKKQTTIPVNKIQAIELQESLIRQPLRYVTVVAEVAGSSDEGGGETILFPMLKQDEVEDFLKTILPNYAGLPKKFIPLPNHSLKYYLFRASFLLILITLAVQFFYPRYVLIPIIVLIFSVFLGILRYRDSGYHLEKKRLMIRTRRFSSRITVVMYHKRIQAFEKKQHVIQKRDNLATMELSIMGVLGGKHYTLKDMHLFDVERLVNWYSYRKRLL